MCSFLVKPPPRQPVPCVPSPCGANAECRVVDDRAVCSCLSGMYGAPPNCRPECVIDQDCPLSLACVGNKCRDPCVGSCGFNALCNVVNHRPICSCPTGFEGDPFSDGCNSIPSKTHDFLILSFFVACSVFSLQILQYCFSYLCKYSLLPYSKRHKE